MVIFIVGCSDFSKIETPQKSIVLESGNLYLEGRWKLVGGKKDIVPRINFVRITCFKSQMICVENQAKLLMPNESNLVENPLLFSDTFEYIITEWSDTILRAERNPPVADIDFRISLTDNSAEKNFRETTARGSKTANSDVFGKWVLE